MKLPNRTFIRKLKFQRGRCFYCGDLLSDKKIEIDHIIAKSKGGSGENNNLCLSCRSCNRKKSNKTINQFREISRKKLIRGLFYFEFLSLKNGAEYEEID